LLFGLLPALRAAASVQMAVFLIAVTALAGIQVLTTAAVVAAVTEVEVAEVPMGEPVRSNRRIEADLKLPPN
jgi:hypothetical protein